MVLKRINNTNWFKSHIVIQPNGYNIDDKFISDENNFKDISVNQTYSGRRDN